MAWQFWRSAHNHTCKDIRSDLRLRSVRRLVLYSLMGLTFGLIASAGVWYDVPLHRTLTLSALSAALLTLPAIYVGRMIGYPALRLRQLEATIVTLAVRLDTVGATETLLVRLGELLHAARQLQHEDVRSEAQLGTWTSRYQNVVEVAYSQINLHLSHSAATAFITYPLLKPVYIRGSFNDQHGAMRALLGSYVLKLSTMIDGYYLHLHQGTGPVPVETELVPTELAA